MLMAPAINVQGLYPCWQRCRRDSAAGMIFCSKPMGRFQSRLWKAYLSVDVC